jgi:hypothetical protein
MSSPVVGTCVASFATAKGASSAVSAAYRGGSRAASPDP